MPRGMALTSSPEMASLMTEALVQLSYEFTLLGNLFEMERLEVWRENTMPTGDHSPGPFPSIFIVRSHNQFHLL